MGTDAIDQHQHQGAIVHVQPIASSNKLVRSIPCERAVGVGTKIGLVKAGHRDREEVGMISILRCDSASWKLYTGPGSDPRNAAILGRSRRRDCHRSDA